jgi:hypothetical protein
MYTVSLKEWTSSWMTAKIDFANPLEVSQGRIKDLLSCRVLQLQLFVSKKSGMPLLMENSEFRRYVPKQLKLGVL